MKIQATAVALDGKAYLITGKSGVGKSALALALLNRGAKLIADDFVVVTKKVVSALPHHNGWLEVRGIGLLSGFDFCPAAPLAAEIQILSDKPDRIPGESKNKWSVFSLWSADTEKVEKVLAIHKLLNGTLKKEN